MPGGPRAESVMTHNYWEGKTVRLRGIEPSDAETFQAWNQDVDWSRNVDAVWLPTSIESIRRWTQEEALRRTESESFHWIIETLNKVPIGAINTHGCEPRNGVYNLAFAIA